MDYEYFMKEALKEAQKAFELDEVPIGCVIVRDNAVIARAHNLRNTEKCAISHAETLAISAANMAAGDWRLEDCVIFVTVEPCPMCAGAILQARMKAAVFGTKNKKAGCAGSVLDILRNDMFNHQVEVTEGILSDECSAIMSEFFRNKRRSAQND